jgi:hypothetical protein
MGMTYGHVAHTDRDPLLEKAHEFNHIMTRVTAPEKAALFTIFPFRGYLHAMYGVNLNVCCSRKVTDVVL